MTPAENAAIWAPTRTAFLSVAADIKSLVTGLSQRLTQAQVDDRIDTKFDEKLALAPGAYNTLQKIAAEMAEDDTEFTALASVVGGKADQSAHLAAVDRVADLEAIFAGMPDFAAVYAAAKV
jgi:hypothetical protein